MIRSPSRVAAAVAAAVVAVTAVLAVLAGQVNARAERDLLQREVAQAGAVLTTQIAVLTTQLADAAQVATGTDPGTGGDPGAFEDFAAARVTGAGDRSLSLWRTGGDGQAERLAAEGPDQAGPDGAGFAALLARVPADGTLTVTGILPGEPARLGYALRPAGDTAGLVVYAEAVLPPGRRVQVPPTRRSAAWTSPSTSAGRPRPSSCSTPPGRCRSAGTPPAPRCPSATPRSPWSPRPRRA
jgi:hypothetical protein